MADGRRDGVSDNAPAELVRRLEATSYAASLGEGLQQIADEVYDLEWKDPFGVLEMDSSGVFLHSWWAMLDELRTA